MQSVQFGSILWLLTESDHNLHLKFWSQGLHSMNILQHLSALFSSLNQLLDDFILNLIISFHSINEFRFRFHHDTNLLLKEIHNFTPFTAMVFEITKYNVQLETWSLMIPFVTRTVNTLFGHRRLILERVMKQISRLNDRQRSQNKTILISLNTLYVWCLSAFWWYIVSWWHCHSMRLY